MTEETKQFFCFSVMRWKKNHKKNFSQRANTKRQTRSST